MEQTKPKKPMQDGPVLPGTTTESRGVLYYAVGEQWLKEAILSARSVRTRMPGLSTAIVCREPVSEQLFDLRIEPPDDMDVKQLKMWSLLNSPFELTLYLDTDTYLGDAVWEIFKLLDRFELAATLTPHWSIPKGLAGEQLRQDGVPVSFPKISGGLLAFRATPRMQQFFRDWAGAHRDGGVGQDQPWLRKVLYDSDIRYAIMPPAYNYRLPYPAGIRGVIKIFHGRVPDMVSVCERLNNTEGWRATGPRDMIYPTMNYGISWLHWLARRIRRSIDNWLKGWVSGKNLS